MARQNLTVQLDETVIRKAKVLAAQRGTSLSGFVASTIERLVADEEAWEAAHRRALEQLERFKLGGKIRVRSRDEWHER